MLLNTGDLESWMADPEEWVNLEDKENDQWEYEIRVRLKPSLNEVMLIVRRRAPKG